MSGVCAVNRLMLPVKLFYFAIMAAIVSFLPFLPHYLKQQGFGPLDATTILAAVPFIGILARAIVGHLADWTRRYKLVLLTCLLSMTVFVTAVRFVPPVYYEEEHSSPTHNMTSCSTALKFCNSTALNKSSSSVVNCFCSSLNQTVTCTPGGNMNGSSTACSNCSSCSLEDERRIHVSSSSFWVLFLTIVLGTSFGAAPANTIIDAICIGLLHGSHRDYGRQRMWSALGIAISMLTVAAVMDAISEPGGKVNYDPSFIWFCFFSILAFSAACFITVPDSMSAKKKSVPSAVPLTSQLTTQINKEDVEEDGATEQLEAVGLRRFFPVMRKTRVAMMALITLILGMNMGVARWLGVWHLKRLGAPQMLIGISSVVASLSAMISMFLSGKLINLIGNEWTHAVVLVLFAVRSLCYSFLVNPWFVILIDIMFGVLMGLLMSNVVSYAGVISPPGCQASGQAVFGAINDGLGVGLGNILSGVIVQQSSAEFAWWCTSIFSWISFVADAVLLLAMSRLKVPSAVYIADQNQKKVITDEEKLQLNGPVAEALAHEVEEMEIQVTKVV